MQYPSARNVSYTYTGLKNGVNLVLEIKGQDSQENRSKRQFLNEWVKAENEHGGFGLWSADVVLKPKEVLGVLRTRAAVLLKSLPPRSIAC